MSQERVKEEAAGAFVLNVAKAIGEWREAHPRECHIASASRTGSNFPFGDVENQGSEDEHDVAAPHNLKCTVHGEGEGPDQGGQYRQETRASERQMELGVGHVARVDLVLQDGEGMALQVGRWNVTVPQRLRPFTQALRRLFASFSSAFPQAGAAAALKTSLDTNCGQTSVMKRSDGRNGEGFGSDSKQYFTFLCRPRPLSCADLSLARVLLLVDSMGVDAHLPRRAISTPQFVLTQLQRASNTSSVESLLASL